jgi:hypothetical protein
MLKVKNEIIEPRQEAFNPRHLAEIIMADSLAMRFIFHELEKAESDCGYSLPFAKQGDVV